MIDKARIADGKTHYGNGRRATGTFRWQRLTGGFNIAFLLFLIWFVVRLAGADRAEMVAVLRNPLVALVMCLLLVSTAVHMRIGMLEVIEDYLDEGRRNRLGVVANNLFAIAVAAIGILAVLKILIWG